MRSVPNENIIELRRLSEKLLDADTSLNKISEVESILLDADRKINGLMNDSDKLRHYNKTFNKLLTLLNKK